MTKREHVRYHARGVLHFLTQPESAHLGYGVLRAIAVVAVGVPNADDPKTYKMSEKRYRTRSVAWEHFRESDTTKEEVICDYCGEKVRRGGGTSNMLKHLIRKHPARLPKPQKRTVTPENRVSSRSSSPSPDLQDEELEEERSRTSDTAEDLQEAGPSSSQTSRPPVRHKPVERTLEAVINRDRNRNPLPGEYYNVFPFLPLKQQYFLSLHIMVLVRIMRVITSMIIMIVVMNTR